jgi:hypothetical protein
MIPRLWFALLLLSGWINAVPAAWAVLPDRHALGFMEVDISGLGNEGAKAKKKCAGSSRDNAAAKVREWREMAARCRNLAQWTTGADQDVLLGMAEEYEARARRIEQRESDTLDRDES